MFEYFYHEIIRKTIVSFGTLFNNISIRHKNDAGQITNEIKIPLSYGPTQKFLARLEQSEDLSKKVQVSLPRMSFEMTGITYDPGRKVTTTQTFISPLKTDPKTPKKVYLPVPYNLAFELSIYTKLNDDMLQIIEQILPYFQPAYTLSVDLVNEIGEKRDIPIVLENITMSDDYEGNFEKRRSLIYTLRFTAKTYIFGPTNTASKDVIKKISVGLVEGNKTSTPSREIVYSAEPRAIKSYTNNVVTNLTKDISSTDTSIQVTDTSQLSVGKYIDVNSEEMYINSIVDNIIIVTRGADNTNILEHVSGSDVKLITPQDNNLIEVGDDFGFSETF